MVKTLCLYLAVFFISTPAYATFIVLDPNTFYNDQSNTYLYIGAPAGTLPQNLDIISSMNSNDIYGIDSWHIASSGDIWSVLPFDEAHYDGTPVVPFNEFIGRENSAGGYIDLWVGNIVTAGVAHLQADTFGFLVDDNYSDHVWITGTTVPEPASLFLLAAGLGALALLRKRMR